MVAEFMVQPSSWIEQGVKIQMVRGLQLFKFTQDVQQRFEELVVQCKEQQLSQEQEAELRGLQELDRIFTMLNARLIARV